MTALASELVVMPVDVSHESQGVLNDPNTHQLGKNFAVLASCSAELKIGCDHVCRQRYTSTGCLKHVL